MNRAGSTSGPPTEALLNLARYHREHEKHYAIAPLRDAEVILRASRTLKALADRWSRAEALLSDQARPAFSGCEDLNDTTAIETSGVLFMEGAGEPAELIRLKQDLRARAEGSQQAGSWLAEAMGTSWESAGALLHIPHLADLLGESSCCTAPVRTGRPPCRKPSCSPGTGSGYSWSTPAAKAAAAGTAWISAGTATPM